MAKFTCPLQAAYDEWENRHVMHGDRRPVTAEEAAAVLGYVWQMCGLPNRPPQVLRVTRDSRLWEPGAAAYVEHDGWRVVLQAAWCNTAAVLHEAAHLLTDDPLDAAELRPCAEVPRHGPLFMQNALWLYGRLLGPACNPFRLRATMPAALNPLQIPLHPVIWGKPRSDLA